MTQKGLIIKVEKHHLMVLTDTHDYIRLKIKDHAVVGQKIFFTDEDILLSDRFSNWGDWFNQKNLRIASIFIAVILVGGIWNMGGPTLQAINSVASSMEDTNPGETSLIEPEGTLVATIMTIDINPSIKLSLDQNDVVLFVKALNEDASTLNFEGIVGMSAESAVEQIVKLARESGFINEEDLDEDYVLITTVPMNEASEKAADTLKKKLESKIETSNELQNVNVALMKAEKRQMFEAEGKKIPPGLYVVNGNVDMDDETLTVKEYFSNTDRVENFKEKGTLIDKKYDKKVTLATKFIEKLEALGLEEAKQFRAALSDKDVDIDVLLNDIKTLWSTVETSAEETSEQIVDEDDDQNGPPVDNPGKGHDKNGNKKTD